MKRVMKDMYMDFYKDKRVLVTGHTGFKGSWLCKMLINLGAKVTGYSLDAPTEPNLFSLTGLAEDMNSIIGDIRDFDKLFSVFCEVKPEIVFHLAAQPIVREGYKKPLYTYETNIMGTINVLECVRRNDFVKSVIIVTTDKVYRNEDDGRAYREGNILDGFDPYSNSKSCADLVTQSYKRCFFEKNEVAISTVRAGNVIGGGDFAKDRIIPDCIRAVENHEVIQVRNPNAIRPYQHVLEPLSAYLLLAWKQYECIDLAGAYNIGPEENQCITTGELVKMFCDCWGNEARWTTFQEKDAPYESNFLKLDCNKIKQVLNWKPKLTIQESVEKICQFSKKKRVKEIISEEMNMEIDEFWEG